MAIFNLRWPGKKQQEAGNQRVIRAPRSNPAESVEAMRRRARHRLIGATVLVLLAIIGFPMLFDTQPRPVPVNAAIEIPDRERVAALAVPPAAPVSVPRGHDNGLVDGEEIVSSGANSGAAVVAGTAAGAAAAVVANAAPAKPAVVAPAPAKPEPKAEVKPERKPDPKPEPKPEAKPKEEHKPAAKPEPKPEAKPKEEKPKDAPKPEAKPTDDKPKESAKPKRDDDADRIRAMMEGRQASAAAATAAKPEAAAPAAASSRYIIQVGAFAEADKASEVRAKLQMAGVPAFTQNVKTSAGNRVRVRVGPFNSKDEAERAAAKVKAQGLPAALVPM
ncbi:MAG: SPOR domain-containing protein [Comamonas sp.]